MFTAWKLAHRLAFFTTDEWVIEKEQAKQSSSCNFHLQQLSKIKVRKVLREEGVSDLLLDVFLVQTGWQPHHGTLTQITLRLAFRTFTLEFKNLRRPLLAWTKEGSQMLPGCFPSRVCPLPNLTPYPLQRRGRFHPAVTANSHTSSKWSNPTLKPSTPVATTISYGNQVHKWMVHWVEPLLLSSVLNRLLSNSTGGPLVPVWQDWGKKVLPSASSRRQA